mgnify:CR=1 FL=1
MSVALVVIEANHLLTSLTYTRYIGRTKHMRVRPDEGKAMSREQLELFRVNPNAFDITPEPEEAA